MTTSPGRETAPVTPVASASLRGATSTSHRRLSWGVIDQGASSFTNLMVAVFVGRVVSLTEFGSFAAAMLAYQIANALVRGIVSEPVVVRWSGHDRTASETAVARSLGASITLTLPVSLAVAGVGLTGDGSFRSQMLLLALTLPGLQLQDAVRFVALTWKRPAVAAAVDLVWCGLMIVGGVALAAAGVDSPLPYLLVWTIGGVITGPLGLLLLSIRPDLGGTVRYVSDHSTLAASYGFEAVATRGAPRLATVGVGLLAGVAEFAGLRGALLFGTQLAVLTQAVRLVAIPESVRGRTAHDRAVVAMRAMWVLTAITVVGSGLLLALPDVAGRQLLGDTWAVAQPLLIWVLLRQVFAAAAIGPEIALRAFANSRLSLWSRLANSVLLVGFGLAGAVVDGARGAAIGMAIAQVISAGIWFVAYREGLRVALDRESIKQPVTQPTTQPTAWPPPAPNRRVAR